MSVKIKNSEIYLDKLPPGVIAIIRKSHIANDIGKIIQKCGQYLMVYIGDSKYVEIGVPELSIVVEILPPGTEIVI